MATCPCDNQTFSDCLEIPGGLGDLDRHYLSFGVFRKRLIEAIANHPELTNWSAEGEQDLGVMLLEMWAYVLDVTQFYDERIAEESFLKPAKRDVSTQRLIRLLGYRPRPALSASVTLTADADGTEAVIVPKRTAFRSEAFGEEAAQVFSLLTDQTIRPERNGWRIAPVPSADFPGKLLFATRDAGVPKTGVLGFRRDGEVVHAGQIAAVETVTAPDGQRYLQVELVEGLAPLAGAEVDDISVRLLGLSAGPTAFGSVGSDGELVLTIDGDSASEEDAPVWSADTLWLDGVYPQIRTGRMAVLEVAETLYPFEVAGVGRVNLRVSGDPDLEKITAPATTVTLPPIDGLVLTESTDYRLHFNPIRVGRPIAPAKTELALEDLDAGTKLEPLGPRTGDMLSGGFVVCGAKPLGAKLDGNVSTNEVTKDVTFSPGTGNASFSDDMVSPIVLKGNQLTAVRGEGVIGEVIGSADGGRADNRFKLKNSPLSWIEDASAPGGIKPLLEVTVTGILWHRVDTLYAAGPNDRVYVVEADEKGDSWVIFGDGARGAIPETGTDNIVASYYHGAGAAKPPPGSIKQIAKPVKGLKRVINPLHALGGKDREAAKDIKANAPAAALTLGRAVSVLDFAALARTYPGVLNIAAGWAWDKRRQRAIVSIWVIGDGEFNANALEFWLAGQAMEETPIRVIEAGEIPKTLTLSTEIHPDHPTEETRAAIHAALTNTESGMLAKRNIPIGGALYRSQIVKVAQTVPGVVAVTSIRLGGAEMDWAVKAPLGEYFDFVSVMVI